eukprot:TRINITY_DN15050_c0_g2_i1.p1 TRINITY_DN15050_c0_g2~~TRINITY_DN15050_c0_g2_i1.p1  ORF type:complete len:624 (+),score=139.80 TRINITY_DN15050_c0_g2_i1:104-1975(+)
MQTVVGPEDVQDATGLAAMETLTDSTAEGPGHAADEKALEKSSSDDARRPSQQSTAAGDSCSPPSSVGVNEDDKAISEADAEDESGLEAAEPPAVKKGKCAVFIGKMQKYAVPLLSGILVALVWANLDHDSYHWVMDEPIFPEAEVVGHPVSLHFIVNDVFMCFFFGLAIKEVTEALLPGGALNPLRRAMNPLIATLGGVLGPAGVYICLVKALHYSGAFDSTVCEAVGSNQDHHGHHDESLAGGLHQHGEHLAASAGAGSSICELNTLVAGWGVPTATDISLAWLGAVLIFRPGHPVINFLLLLAILDDALGMVIIAVFYPDPTHPVEPQWLALLAGAAAMAFILRKLDVQAWQVYVYLCGPLSWFSLLKAHVHPALALVIVVPFMPAKRAIYEKDGEVANLGACDLGPGDNVVRHGSRMSTVSSMSSVSSKISGSVAAIGTIAKQSSRSFQQQLRLHDFNDMEAHAPLHQFEHQLKLPVDFGMFFFGLTNAGVKLGNVGGITFSVLGALIVGKIVGITLMSMCACAMGFGLPPGVTMGDILTMSALAGIGLTVALFVATEAFPQENLQGEAKMGALLSVCGFALASVLKKLTSVCGRRRSLSFNWPRTRAAAPAEVPAAVV